MLNVFVEVKRSFSSSRDTLMNCLQSLVINQVKFCLALPRQQHVATMSILIKTFCFQLQIVWSEKMLPRSECKNIDQNYWNLREKIVLYRTTYLGTKFKYVMNKFIMGSCCGLVGRAVTSNTSGLQFKTSHLQFFIHNFHVPTMVEEKTKI